MPRSGPGSSRAHVASRPGRGAVHGFTLIELMMVVALIAVAAGVVSLSLRDGAQTRLDREGVRLATLLESARAEARSAGVPVQWQLTPDGERGPFRFIGLPASRQMPAGWLDPEVRAVIVGGRPALQLGPEPLIPPQRVRLTLGERSVDVATDGLGPFGLADTAPATP